MQIKHNSFQILHIVSELTILSLLIIVLSPYWVVDAIPDSPHTIIQVTTESDEYGEGSLCSLREAIQTADTDFDFGGCNRLGTGPEVINLPAGTYVLSLHGPGEDGNASGDLDIHSSMGLLGAGSGVTIIQGDGEPGVNDRVIHIVRNDAEDFIVTMWDVAITGGNPGSGDGGGILNEESLWISRVTVYENESLGNGGGVASKPLHAGQSFRAYLSSSISNNAAASGQGGGIYLGGHDLALDHVEVAGNTADVGAGLFIKGSMAEVDWTNLHNNTAVGDGGGIYMDGGQLSLQDSGIHTNTTGGNGGNLYLSSLADGGEISRCYIGDGEAFSGAGAGIYNTAVLTMTTTTLTNNVADHAAGIYHAPATTSGVTLMIHDSTIAYNNINAPDGQLGEGLYNAQDHTDIEIKNSIFSRNGDPGSSGNNCYSSNPSRLVSLGTNLDSGGSCQFSLGSDLPDTDPMLGSLDYHGGFTLNYALDSLSPALEAGGSTCLAADQRGYVRPMDQNRDGVALCDIGAYEAEPYYLPPIIWFAMIFKP
jgi:CSLREA domain-containing protein